MATSSENIKLFALSAGADLVGIAPALYDRADENHLREFIEEGRNAEMKWLEDFGVRVHPEKLLPGAKSAIVIGVNYYTPDAPLPSGHGRVARYARGRDYHKVLRGILKKLVRHLESGQHQMSPQHQKSTFEVGIAKSPGAVENAPQSAPACKICVDSSPILEKSYAVKAGLGFIGKNTTLITPEFGSFVLLGTLLTTLELDYNCPRTGTCGTCTRCLDTCPTKALLSAGKMDARRCISYLTIEHKREIPAEFTKKIAPRLFGCDTCQEVCPYNKSLAKPAKNKDILKEIAGASISLKEITDIKTDEEFLKRFAGSPLMRAKRAGLQRNARFIRK